MRITLPQNKAYPGGRSSSGWPMYVLFVVTMLCSAISVAEPIDLFFLVSKPTTDYVDVLTTVQEELNKQFPEKYRYSVEFVSERRDSQPAVTLPTADLIVTIGTAAADRAYQYQAQQSKLGAPIISVLITDSSFVALASKYFGSVDQAFAQQVSAICIDQPTSRSIRLAKLLLPKAKKAGVMLGHSSVKRQQELANSINEAGMTPEFVTIDANDNPITKIEPVIRNTDVFIPVPDSRLINIATAKWILHLSYRHKVPVIAFSRTYVKAGALAAIYSSQHNVAMQAVELIAGAAIEGSKRGQAYPPKYYSIHFNYSVAASLNVPIKSEQYYREQLREGAR
jgi:putative ABC transport system substrate-binding protein